MTVLSAVALLWLPEPSYGFRHLMFHRDTQENQEIKGREAVRWHCTLETVYMEKIKQALKKLGYFYQFTCN